MKECKFYTGLFFTLVCFSCFLLQSITSAQTITTNSSGSHGGYRYEFWKDNSTGTASMTLDSGGAFRCQWNGINNVLFRKGLRPGSKNIIINYSAEYNPSGNSYLSVYGWTTRPLIEYYIVESWGTWRPPGGTSLGNVTSDGGTYNIYRTERVNQPSIQGTQTFYQYWSVRTSKRAAGTITCSNHFKAWAALALRMGDFYEVSFLVEGYQSSGSANINSMTMTTASTGIQEDAVTPSVFALEQNYPNPFNPVTAINYSIAESAPVTLTVYDIKGCEVTKLINGYQYPGSYTINFDAGAIPNGIYFYTLSAGSYRSTKKMILLK